MCGQCPHNPATCFEARQKRILIGSTHNFVDLVFYHRILKCHILVELMSSASVASVPPLIASLLLRCNYIEKMGTGIERIRAALERENCPEVNIRYNTMFILEFPRPTYLKADGRLGEARRKASEKTSEKILHLVAKNQLITIAELAQAIGVTPRSIERNIKNLQTQGRLKRVGPDKGGRWDIIKKE